MDCRKQQFTCFFDTKFSNKVPPEAAIFGSFYLISEKLPYTPTGKQFCGKIFANTTTAERFFKVKFYDTPTGEILPVGVVRLTPSCRVLI